MLLMLLLADVAATSTADIVAPTTVITFCCYLCHLPSGEEKMNSLSWRHKERDCDKESVCYWEREKERERERKREREREGERERDFVRACVCMCVCVCSRVCACACVSLFTLGARSFAVTSPIHNPINLAVAVAILPSHVPLLPMGLKRIGQKLLFDPTIPSRDASQDSGL